MNKQTGNKDPQSGPLMPSPQNEEDLRKLAQQAVAENPDLRWRGERPLMPLPGAKDPAFSVNGARNLRQMGNAFLKGGKAALRKKFDEIFPQGLTVDRPKK